MADGIILNSGSGGETCATDDVSGVQYQYVKLADGTADSSTKIAAGNGTAATSLRVTLASDSTGIVALTTSTASIGKLAANSGVDIGDVDITSIIPGTGATNLGKAIDTATGATDTGVLVLATRDDALSSLTPIEGDNVQLRVDSTGALWCTISGTVTVGSHAVTNAGTFAVQESGAALTALQLIDDVVYTDDADWTALSSKHSLIGGVYQSTPGTITDGDTGPIRVDQNGHIIISPHGTGVALADSTGNTVNLIDDDGGSLLANACFGFMFNGTSWDRIRGAAADGLLVNLGTNNDVTVTSGTVSISGTVTVGSHAVTNAGTFAVQVDGTALTRLTDIETNTDSGAVVGNGAAATSQRVTIANDSTGILAGVTTVTTVTTVGTLTGGGIAHDSADSGNPVKIGAKASATLSDDTMVANADRTDATSDLDGALLVRTGFPLGDLITERVSNTDGASTAFTNFGATASTRNYITSIVVYNSSATAGYVDIRDGTAGSILYTIPLPAGGGAVIGNGSTPILYSTANTALAFDVSAALTTVYISVTGFKSKVRA